MNKSFPPPGVLMSGELAKLAPVIDRVANTLALLEAGIDFSDEEISFLSTADLLANVGAADQMLQQLLDDSIRFNHIAHEPSVVLAGRPNAGKSTLLTPGGMGGPLFPQSRERLAMCFPPTLRSSGSSR